MLTLFVQPLMDNLQSITYQTFEQDPVKYRNYEEVCRIVSHVVYTSPNVSVGDIPCFEGSANIRKGVSRGSSLHMLSALVLTIGGRTICVAGAGRGPLVARALKAIERAKVEAFIYAVEKNPNAYVT